jgi:hypothetical protein
MIGSGNRSTRRKPAAMLLCPPQTPHAARKRTRAAAVYSVVTEPATQWVPVVIHSGLKRQGREADHSRQSRAEVELYLHSAINPLSGF